MAESRTDRAGRPLFLRKSVWISVILLAVLCTLTIYLYDSSRSSFGIFFEPSEIGRLGLVLVAAFVEVGVLAFGMTAYALPAVLAAYAISSILRRSEQWTWTRALIETSGLLMLIVSVCVLAYFLPFPGAVSAYGAGGFIGSFFLNLMTSYLPQWGVIVLCLTLSLVAVRLLYWFSWLNVMETLGRMLELGYVKSKKTASVGARGIGALAEYRAKQKRTITTESRKPRRTAKAHTSTKEPILAPTKKQAKKDRIQGSAASSEKRARVTATRTRETSPAKSTSAEIELPSKRLLQAGELNLSDHKRNVESERIAQLLAEKLADFRVSAEVVSISPGPVVTRFDVQPAPGVKGSTISSLANDLARELKVIKVRVVEIVAGESVVGIEIPNQDREIVSIRDVLDASEPDAPLLQIALGKDISGEPVFADLARMPHLLVAGATGSGKSVGLNSMLMSLLYHATPEQVRLLLIDPKVIELSVYDGIPHLLTPVVTDMDEAARALSWCVMEMERRYSLLACLKTRSLADFNERIREAEEQGEPILDPSMSDSGDEEPRYLSPLPMIVVVVDEFADMMITVGKKTETLIARIAQKARAAGIHLIVATQRPSVDVITGSIKANITGRIAFQVASKTDSRTILDQGGAEQLLGQGDMLFIPPGTSMARRVHGAYVSDREIETVVNHWREQATAEYVEEVTAAESSDSALSDTMIDPEADQDELYPQVLDFFCDNKVSPSISSIQRAFKIGFNRAGRIVDQMEAAGVISPPGDNGKRRLLVEVQD